jgi:hypothetical protein
LTTGTSLVRKTCKYTYCMPNRFGWEETNPSNIYEHPYLTSAKAISIAP